MKQCRKLYITFLNYKCKQRFNSVWNKLFAQPVNKFCTPGNTEVGNSAP